MDIIPPRLLKESAPPIATPLARLINYCLEQTDRSLLQGCHGLPCLKMGLGFFFSGEKLIFLRNIASIRINN